MVEGFAHIPGIKVVFPVETILIYIDVSGTGLTAQQVVEQLDPVGVRLGAFYDERNLRAVTHYEITREDCDIAVAAPS